MTIEAWVSLRLQGDSRQKLKGDIMQLKLPGSPVGSEETEPFLIIVDWEDTANEDELLEMQSEATPWPVINAPYLVTETKPEAEVLPDDIVEGEPDENGLVEVWKYRSNVFVEPKAIEELAEAVKVERATTIAEIASAIAERANEGNKISLNMLEVRTRT